MPKQLEKIKSRIRSLLIKNGIKKAGIFGSYARGDYKRGSDIDILILTKNTNKQIEKQRYNLTLISEKKLIEQQIKAIS